MTSVSIPMLHLERHHGCYVALPHTAASPESTGNAFWSFSVLTPLSLIGKVIDLCFPGGRKGSMDQDTGLGIGSCHYRGEQALVCSLP